MVSSRASTKAVLEPKMSAPVKTFEEILLLADAYADAVITRSTMTLILKARKTLAYELRRRETALLQQCESPAQEKDYDDSHE